MLEDEFTDVVRKAMKGLGLAPSAAARQAGLAEEEVLAFTRGAFSEKTARSLAPVLGLKAEALAGLPSYAPSAPAPPGVHRLDLPFGEYRVNAWVIVKDGTALLFDTGNDATSCTDALSELGIHRLLATFITHAHRDHIAGNAAATAVSTMIHGPENLNGVGPVAPGDRFVCGPLEVEAIDLSGHAAPSLAYAVHGLDLPVLVVGDALFAGSIGGCPDEESYHHALARLNAVLSPLPGKTVILPGHGPATTLAEERERNPFPITGHPAL